MKALRLAPLLIICAMVLVFAGCNKNDEAQCQTSCKKGIVLAKQAMTEAMKDADQAVKTDVLAEWSKQESQLNSLIPSCVERCVREPDSGMIACLGKAKSLQSYLGCLK